MRTRIGSSGRVPDLVQPFLAAPEADDVALAASSCSPSGVRSVGAPAEDDHPLLVRVVRVVRPEPIPGLELVHAPAYELGADVRADPRVLAAPARALLDAIPLVAVEVEDVHDARA